MAISVDPNYYNYDNGEGKGIQNSAEKLSSQSSEEELKSVLKDFESYFLEQIIKDMKETFTWKSDDKSSGISQYEDIYMDTVVEQLADKILDEEGNSLTQQLYEQMKRNYNIE